MMSPGAAPKRGGLCAECYDLEEVQDPRARNHIQISLNTLLALAVLTPLYYGAMAITSGKGLVWIDAIIGLLYALSVFDCQARRVAPTFKSFADNNLELLESGRAHTGCCSVWWSFVCIFLLILFVYWLNLLTGRTEETDTWDARKQALMHISEQDGKREWFLPFFLIMHALFFAINTILVWNYSVLYAIACRREEDFRKARAMFLPSQFVVAPGPGGGVYVMETGPAMYAQQQGSGFSRQGTYPGYGPPPPQPPTHNSQVYTGSQAVVVGNPVPVTGPDPARRPAPPQPV